MTTDVIAPQSTPTIVSSPQPSPVVVNTPSSAPSTVPAQPQQPATVVVQPGYPGASAYTLAGGDAEWGSLSAWLLSLSTGGVAITSVSAITNVEQVIAQDGAQTLPLPKSSIAIYARLSINGLRQGSNEFSISGNTLTLPAALQLVAGDIVDLDYV